MELEIDRRCPDCGAAVRVQSAFCPQCGRAMKESAGDAGALLATMESPEATKSAAADKDGGNSNRPLAATIPSARASEISPAPPPTSEPPSIPAQIAREQIASGKVAQPTSPEPTLRVRGQRVVGAARDAVEERLAPGVEKLRQASNVVWGEAQDDPNLRFILVAVFLFILAIVIIVLGTYLR